MSVISFDLSMVIRDTPEFDFVEELFNATPPQGKESVYYATGDYSGCSQLKISDKNIYNETEECNGTPILYLSDRDDSDREGDKIPDFSPPITVFTDDFSISMSSELSSYFDIAEGMTDEYPSYSNDNKIRGLCYTCTEYNLDIPSFKSNVLKCGYEIIKAWPEGYKGEFDATLPIQSRSDANFVFAHGNYDIENEPQPYEAEVWPLYASRLKYWQKTQSVDAIGPFTTTTPNAYISFSEWGSSGMNGETQWLLTNPECLLLNDVSWFNWQSLIGPGKLSAICGFTANIPYGQDDLEIFYRELTNDLWDSGNNPEMWACSIPSNTAIISWMEKSLFFSKERTLLDLFRCSAAIDGSTRYYIKYGKNLDYPDLKSNYFIYN